MSIYLMDLEDPENLKIETEDGKIKLVSEMENKEEIYKDISDRTKLRPSYIISPRGFRVVCLTRDVENLKRNKEIVKDVINRDVEEFYYCNCGYRFNELNLELGAMKKCPKCRKDQTKLPLILGILDTLYGKQTALRQGKDDKY